MADQNKKQADLVESIALGTRNKLAADFKVVVEGIARLEVLVNGVATRVAVLEANSGGAAAPKRAVRAGAAAPGKAADKKADGSKVANSLLYFRHILAFDLDSARDLYGTPENIAAVEAIDAVSKQNKDKDANAWWSAVGAAMWKLVLSDQQKDTVKTEFATWKEEMARANAAGALGEDPSV